jgi:hypothetical protein
LKLDELLKIHKIQTKSTENYLSGEKHKKMNIEREANERDRIENGVYILE